MKLYNIFRWLKLFYYRFQIKEKNTKRSIICNNCLGGIITHNFHLRHNSPFVNLWISTSDYIEMLRDLSMISKWNMEDVTPENSKYPIGLLNSKWKVYCMHYASFNEARVKWNERVERLDVNDVYVILVETSSCTYENLIDFDNLPYKNKLIITHKVYNNIRNSMVITGYDGKNENGELFTPSNRCGGMLYDQVDWLEFLKLR